MPRIINRINSKSYYAKHLLDHNHPLHSIEDTMLILHTTEKGRLLNIIKNFYIYNETAAKNQHNDRMTVAPSIIFDKILRHAQTRDAT
jgi:hypothetical protein